MQKFVSFNWRVDQTELNKNRICSDNWSAVMDASYWLKLEPCSSANSRLHGTILSASVLFIINF